MSLAKAEATMTTPGRFTLITQNVDEFHQRAGSKNVIEIHGNLMRTRCSRSACDYQPHYDESVHTEQVPLCPHCNSPLRPDIVLFGEDVKLEEDQTNDIFYECDLFIAAGTSGTVFPAASFVQHAKSFSAKTVYINMDPVSNNVVHFDLNLTGKTKDILPRLFD